TGEQDPRKSDPSELPLTVFEAKDAETGRTAVLLRTDGGDRTRRSTVTRLAVLPAKEGGREVSCEAAACTGKSISSVQWRPDGRELLFTVTDRDAGEAQSIFLWNIGTGEVRPVVASQGFLNGGRTRSSTCGMSATALACVAAEASNPPRLEIVDIASGKRHVLFEPNAALDADLEQAISSRMISWADEDGKRFSGQLFVGHSGTKDPRPLFINYYRCTGFLRGGTGDEW